MNRRYERGQLILPAVLIATIGTIAAIDIVNGSGRRSGAPDIAHHSTPHEVIGSNHAGIEGGVEAPPSLSRDTHHHISLTHSGILETGGTAAP